MQLKALLFSLLATSFSVSALANSALCERLFAVQTPNFDTLKSFGDLDRITDLWTIKKYIEFKGGDVTIVVDYSDIPKRMSAKLINFLYGANVVVVRTDEVPESPKKLDGVVLHFGDSDHLKKHFVGDLNLLKGWRSYSKFDNKVYEVEWATSIVPSIMPRSLKFSDIKDKLNSEPGASELLSQVAEIKRSMAGNPKFEFSSIERKILIQYLDLVMKLINDEFPGGAVIKHAREFQTGDTGGIIKSNKNNSDEIVDRFISSFYQIRKIKLKTGKKKLSSKDFDEDRESAEFNKHYTLVQSLIYGQFEELMAQQLLKIKREIRLDVARGNVINVVDRFDEIWGSPELFEAAKQFVNEFFRKVPHPYNLMAGGVDIALLEDGRFVIVDFNFGATSGFLDGPKAPVTTNMYVAILTGRKTPFLEELALIGHLPYMEKLDALNAFANKYLKHLSESKRSDAVFDMVRWLRHENLIDAIEEAALLFL